MSSSCVGSVDGDWVNDLAISTSNNGNTHGVVYMSLRKHMYIYYMYISLKYGALLVSKDNLITQMMTTDFILSGTGQATKREGRCG